MGLPENFAKLFSSKYFRIFFVSIIPVLSYILFSISEDYIRELFNIPKETTSTLFGDSYLQDELLTKDQLSNHWKWHKTRTSSYIYDPSEENDYPLEKAVREFKGSYDWEKASIRQYIEIYDSNPVLLTNADRLTKGVLSVDGFTSEDWIADIFINEYDTIVKCAYNAVEYRCVITKISDTKLITFIFEVESKSDIEQIEVISIELLSLIN